MEKPRKSQTVGIISKQPFNSLHPLKEQAIRPLRNVSVELTNL